VVVCVCRDGPVFVAPRRPNLIDGRRRQCDFPAVTAIGTLVDQLAYTAVADAVADLVLLPQRRSEATGRAVDAEGLAGASAHKRAAAITAIDAASDAARRACCASGCKLAIARAYFCEHVITRSHFKFQLQLSHSI
jgi:hypothetical protein